MTLCQRHLAQITSGITGDIEKGIKNMTKITRYLFGNDAASTITTRTIDGEHWYMAADICALLEITNHSQAVRDHLIGSEYRKETTYIGGYGKKRILLINNSGMLKLIMAGRSESASRVRNQARLAPAHLRGNDWPAELNLSA